MVVEDAIGEALKNKLPDASVAAKIPRQPPVLEDDLFMPRGSMTLFPSRDTAGGLQRTDPQFCPKQCPHYYIACCGSGDAAQLTGRMLRSLGEALWVHPTQSCPPVERSDLLDIKFGDCVLVVQVISPHWIYCRTCPTRRCWGRNDEWGIVSTAVPFIIYEDLAAMGDRVQRGTQLWLGPQVPVRQREFLHFAFGAQMEISLAEARPSDSWCCEYLFREDILIQDLKCPSREWGPYSPSFDGPLP